MSSACSAAPWLWGGQRSAAHPNFVLLSLPLWVFELRRGKGLSFPAAASAAPGPEPNGLVCSHFCLASVMLVSPDNNGLIPEGIWLHQRQGTWVWFWFFFPSPQILRGQCKGGLGLLSQGALSVHFFPFLDYNLPFLVYCKHKDLSRDGLSRTKSTFFLYK